ncbi:MAG TPA: hypothetical protein VN327_00695 [Pseudonocardiaceae bacterium]|jgi:hypothetical protein|nr:hypothetical protein [Pseudonocardiaceae bacterium]
MAVPRHEFVPRYYAPEPDTRPLRWVAHEPRDAESTQRWLDLVYSPTTLITALVDYADKSQRTTSARLNKASSAGQVD